jgi:threonine/homoserine/homoserine lactone efflux protein
MDEQIQLASQGLLVALCVSTLVLMAVLVYVLCLCVQLHQVARRYLRRPEVERDGSGRRIRERL